MSSDSSNTFVAWRVDETDDGSFVGSEQTLPLPGADDESTVRIKVTHSSLNYKDALSASGNRGVTHNFPHTPGIDAAGTLVTGGDDDGASVLVTGYDLGMNTDGGFGEVITVPRDWIVTPNPFDGDDAARTSMVYGTAGLTAGLCVQKLLTAGGAKPSDGAVLVTGATGGVGSIAVELLANQGFEVVALTGKLERDGTVEAWLKDLGASQVVGREILAPNKRPLLRPSYAHAVDTVGGSPLAELLKTIQNGGSVAACGNAAGLGVNTTVLPFILRGVQLLGVDSVEIPLDQKKDVWNKLSGEWKCPKAEASAEEIGRDALDGCLKKILEGGHSGRTVLVHGPNASSKL
eukprot:jgi/Psemu1/304466/fgenesh1_kg.153_\